MSDALTVRGQVVVAEKALKRLRLQHPWIYRTDVVRTPHAEAGLVSVVSADGRVHGTAMYSPRSMITLRMVARGKEPFDQSVIDDRVAQAKERRERLMPDVDAFRALHGESDQLPGIFVDRYADCLVAQSTTASADVLMPLVVSALEKIYNPRTIIIRSDAGARSREDLEPDVRVVIGEAPGRVAYHEGAITHSIDPLGDQKTGSFLDQAVNHVHIARYAKGTGLDCFTYHGGFALQLAQKCDSVMAVDVSARAVERVKSNAAAAGLSNVDAVHKDAFELLPELVREGRRFDTVVLDPPAFASGKNTEESALRAYNEVNLRAMKLVAPNGVLVSCSCSGRIRPEAFDEMLVEAARSAHRSIHFIERRAAGPDHPVMGGVPETDYLKCRVLTVI
ncbi:MAG: class I SAM-dependent rRNA methyltransferase [Clostridia bacterium]|nr:class I SAM-dependent rRNA methyltransferase [Deltaproteobacteria bacterium]